MARNAQSLGRRPRVRTQDGAPEPVTDENTVWVGRAPDERDDKPAKSKNS